MRSTGVLFVKKAQAKVIMVTVYSKFNLFLLLYCIYIYIYSMNFIRVDYKTQQGVFSHHQYKHVRPGRHDCPITECKRCELNNRYDETFELGSCLISLCLHLQFLTCLLPCINTSIGPILENQYRKMQTCTPYLIMKKLKTSQLT